MNYKVTVNNDHSKVVANIDIFDEGILTFLRDGNLLQLTPVTLNGELIGLSFRVDPAIPLAQGDPTVKEVYDSLSEVQKMVVDFLVGEAASKKGRR